MAENALPDRVFMNTIDHEAACSSKRSLRDPPLGTYALPYPKGVLEA